MQKYENLQHTAYLKFVDATNFIENYSMKLNSYGLVLKSLDSIRYRDWAAGWMAGEACFDSQQGQEIYPFS